MELPVEFYAVEMVPTQVAAGAFYLVRDNWNDWFTWKTMRTLIYVDPQGQRASLGSLKIGRVGMNEEAGTIELPISFGGLGDDYFSLGQSENFYESLAELPERLHDEVLVALRDCAFNTAILAQNANEPVMHRSLLRDISMATVANRYSRLARCQSVLTPYSFRYQLGGELDVPPAISFKVTPGSMPPTNIHVLIGRNGVGKTHTFNSLAMSVLVQAEQPATPGSAAEHGRIYFDASEAPSPFTSPDGFQGIAFVAFSAFDKFRPLTPQQRPEGLKYSYIGLKKSGGEQTEQALKNDVELADEFIDAIALCRIGARLKRWRDALTALESDPLFEETGLRRLADYDTGGWEEGVRTYFKLLSSGHRIVLYTITRLVAVIEERTLLLVDEPEGHLHPPLLSTFVRVLSDLLSARNGVAVIATHSPVVLQEVPRTCAWVVNRTGRSARADRPDIETFGENVGVLTREVFGLEVMAAGFNALIVSAVERWMGDYEQVLTEFGGALGAEGRAIARGLCSKRNKN